MAKAVLVTGGAKRIGAAISARLANAGWRVVVHCHHMTDDAQAFARSIGGVAIAGDLADTKVAEMLPAQSAAAISSPIDAIVNNASVFEYNLASSFTVEEWRRDQDVNCLAPILIARAFAAGIGAERCGSVVNLLDQKLWNLNADFFTYTLSKAGLKSATELLARALAPRVRVNAVAPGLSLPSGNQSDAEFAAVASKYNLMKRPIAVEDIAAAVAFLLENDGVTGQTLLVDNGQHMVASDDDVMFRTRGKK